MQTPLEVGVQAAPEVSDDPARRPLMLMAVFASIATITGTFVFCYPDTLEIVFDSMVVIHDITGDLTIVAAVWYLTIHLKRTWRMWRRVLQRWSGYVSVLVWGAAAVTGVYGQFVEMPSGSTMSTLHAISATAAVVLTCVHSGYGLRRYFT